MRFFILFRANFFSFQRKRFSVKYRSLIRLLKSSLFQVDDSTGASDDQDTIRVLRQEIREKSQEIIGLELRLEKLKQHADHFREVSVAAEESLKQVKTSSFLILRMSLVTPCLVES